MQSFTANIWTVAAASGRYNTLYYLRLLESFRNANTAISSIFFFVYKDQVLFFFYVDVKKKKKSKSTCLKYCGVAGVFHICKSSVEFVVPLLEKLTFIYVLPFCWTTEI